MPRSFPRGDARGELGGYRSEASSPPPPVGENFGFSSEEICQNNARKHHFSVILAPLSEAPAPLSENFWRHHCPPARGQASRLMKKQNKSL